MIKKENKLIQITLDPESLELLYSLASRFHCSKTEIVKQALKILGSSKNHHYTIFLSSKEYESTSKPKEDLEVPEIDEQAEKESPDELPF